MKKIILLLLLLWNNTLIGENIISFPIILTGSTNLGQNMQVQFTVNKLTICDTYSIDYDINYFSNSITITVDYNYISSCSEANFGSIENVSKLVLLTGFYNVTLKLDVSFSQTLDENYQLGSLFVQQNPFASCSDPFIPFVFDVCPLNLNNVCACDGQTYLNECESFFKEKKGLFLNGNCMNYLDFNDQPYECKQYNSSFSKKFFEEYGCLPNEFKGEEMYFKYTQNEKKDLDIRFIASSENVRLFLVKLENNNLVCLSNSVGDSLVFDQLEKGDYYIISDKSEQGNYSVKFCHQTSSVINTSTSIKASLFPNPTNGNLWIHNASKLIEKVEIMDKVGVLVLSKIINSYEDQLGVDGLAGIYIVKIWYKDGASEYQKIICQN